MLTLCKRQFKIIVSSLFRLSFCFIKSSGQMSKTRAIVIFQNGIWHTGVFYKPLNRTYVDLSLETFSVKQLKVKERRGITHLFLTAETQHEMSEWDIKSQKKIILCFQLQKIFDLKHTFMTSKFCKHFATILAFSYKEYIFFGLTEAIYYSGYADGGNNRVKIPCPQHIHFFLVFCSFLTPTFSFWTPKLWKIWTSMHTHAAWD